MDIREGDRVMVNLAPFIGAKIPSKESIPCRVAAVEGGRVRVTSEYPFRSVTLWIAPAWIESGRPECSEEELAESLS